MLRLLLFSLLLTFSSSAEDTRLSIDASQRLQEFQGMGCGAIFYEGHITSLAARGKAALQAELYDAMFKEVKTDFLQLMIRHDHEPQNDNDDPYNPRFDPAWFAYAQDTLAICKAARERNPQIRFYATLYTPPPWMKTNNDPSGGGKQRATIKPEMENELAEYCWAFLAFMQRGGCPIEFLSIANEADWDHDQPGYCLEPGQHAELLKSVSAYLTEMARRFPSVSLAKLVGPNTLSALTAADWLRMADSGARDAFAVVGSHDYDRRGERLAILRNLAGKRPLWVSEWCVNGVDKSPELINSATDYWLAMTEAFNQGVNTWMAYDWAYPPREGGEALIHIDWGNGYHRTKIYDGFRQWCAPLASGMWVVKSILAGPSVTGISQPGVKASAFITADGKRLVAHVANVQDREASLRIDPGPEFAGAKIRQIRTTLQENMAEIPAGAAGTYVLPPRSMNTWEWTLP